MDQDLFVGPVERPDKYRLIRPEGSGGEASLWRAEVDVAGASETVAVKVLRPEHHDDLGRISARWAEQAELLRFVTHPSVVGVREHFEGAPPHAGRGDPPATVELGQALYLVMNWVSGLPLRDWLLLHPGRAGTVAGLRLLEQVANALDMLHTGRVTPTGRPVIHGDLSPGNIMIDDRDRAVLVDFGMVRMASHRTRVAAGTPGFAAPETWSHGEYTPAADRFAFAALGFYLLFGSPPPTGEDQIAERLFCHPFLADTPSNQVDDILRGFSADPDRRPGVLEWLHLLRGGASSSARRTDTTPDPGSQRRLPPADGVPRPRNGAGSARSTGRTRSTVGAPRAATTAVQDIEGHLAECRNGPGELVWLAVAGGGWDVERAEWTHRHGCRSYHVKLRDGVGDWVVVEMQLYDGGYSSRLVWASGAGGAMTECPDDLIRWLAPS